MEYLKISDKSRKMLQELIQYTEIKKWESIMNAEVDRNREKAHEAVYKLKTVIDDYLEINDGIGFDIEYFNEITKVIQEYSSVLVERET